MASTRCSLPAHGTPGLLPTVITAITSHQYGSAHHPPLPDGVGTFCDFLPWLYPTSPRGRDTRSGRRGPARPSRSQAGGWPRRSAPSKEMGWSRATDQAPSQPSDKLSGGGRSEPFDRREGNPLGVMSSRDAVASVAPGPRLRRVWSPGPTETHRGHPQVGGRGAVGRFQQRGAAHQKRLQRESPGARGVPGGGGQPHSPRRPHRRPVEGWSPSAFWTSRAWLLPRARQVLPQGWHVRALPDPRLRPP